MSEPKDWIIEISNSKFEFNGDFVKAVGGGETFYVGSIRMAQRRTHADAAALVARADQSMFRLRAVRLPKNCNPIETAPRDGTPIILNFGDDGEALGFWRGGDEHPWAFVEFGGTQSPILNFHRDGPGVGLVGWRAIDPDFRLKL